MARWGRYNMLPLEEQGLSREQEWVKYILTASCPFANVESVYIYFTISPSFVNVLHLPTTALIHRSPNNNFRY